MIAASASETNLLGFNFILQAGATVHLQAQYGKQDFGASQPVRGALARVAQQVE